MEELQIVAEFGSQEPSLTEILSPLGAHFPNLKTLDFSNNALVSLPDLNGGTGLQMLTFANTKIPEIPDNYLAGLPNVVSASFSGSELKKLGPNSLKGSADSTRRVSDIYSMIVPALS